MIGPAGKTPRHTLPEHEKRLWLEAMLSDRHERRLRRAEQKSTTGEAKEKKKTRKKAMKLTTVAMEIAESKMTGPVAETAGAVAVAEAKETIAAAANAEAIEIVDQQRKPGISMVVVDAVADIVAVIAGKAKSSPRAPTRKRSRRVLQDDTDESDEVCWCTHYKKYKMVNKLKGMALPQGTVKLAQNKKIPQITAAMWMD
ncbi:Pleiotropic drug resistance protein transporter [Phytophthora megakarya]|uniref:Pleiotropic drug resistance protein transporter n=1 Tax=Phytophthora megakarya TaxID=4795 RepID=A0A225VCT5_9STRA|nr:Pleiotropic drug resistance protein transporter [Phytophthora megakarya]